MLDCDRYSSSIRAAIAVTGGIIESIDACESGIGSVSDIVTVIDGCTVWGIRGAVNMKRIAVRVVVVVQDINIDRRILRCSCRIIIRHRRIVRRWRGFACVPELIAC